MMVMMDMEVILRMIWGQDRRMDESDYKRY
jgi:hypothetical protein